MPRAERGAIRVERGDDGVALLLIDVPGEDKNLVQPGFEDEFGRTLDDLDSNEGVRAVVVASAKTDEFVSGADVRVVRELDSVQEAERLSRAAQGIMDRLEGFSRPTVAAIHGSCLGAGLELALACRERVASDHDKTRLGFPEVMLGLIPGAGGTQRLPRRIGLEGASQLILKGKPVRAGKAENMGLVDEVVHPGILLDVARRRALRMADAGEDCGGDGRSLRGTLAEAVSPAGVRSLLLEDNPAGRKVLFSQARKQVLSRTHGNMPAPLRALDVMRRGAEQGMEAGLRAEAEAFAELAMTPEAECLMELFLAREELKGEAGADAEAREVRKVGVLGAGLMGGGIAQVTAAEAGLPVRLKDVDHDTIRDGMRAIRGSLDGWADKEDLRGPERDRIMARIRPTTGYSGFGSADVVIEAVVEDLELKHRVLGEVASRTGRETIFASNTSTIPIRRIAEGVDGPERVAGMHYFSPAEKVPLLEVVRGEATAPWVTATCVALGKRQGKTVIVVKDGTGFYTTRILAPYLDEATRLLQEGASVAAIDDALTDFGFPVGPMELLDQVGIDVAQKAGSILHDDFGERLTPSGVLERMLEDDRLGQKNGRGFYRYRPGEAGEFESEDEADPSVQDLLDVDTEGDIPSGEMADRCAYAFVNEAVRCYEEGILRSARDGDVGAVFGLGFPPFLGGPFRLVDQRGPDEVVERLDELRDRLGDRFEAAALLRKMAADGGRFHSGNGPVPGKASSSDAGTSGSDGAASSSEDQ